MLHGIADLDATDTVRLLEATLRRRRQAEVDDLLLVLHYADLHSAIPAERGPGGEQLGDLGGDGTPGMAELAIVELAVARQVHTNSARAVAADGLDLRHRLPRVLDKAMSLEAELWVARKVASMTRHLSYEAAHAVDIAVADAIGTQSPARVLELAAARIIEVDRAAHEARIEAERQRRYVGMSRVDATGLRTVIARVDATEAAGVDVTITRVAKLLAERPEYADLTADELRAEAFGWLSRPEDVVALEAGDPSPRQHRQRVVLYVHLHEAALDGVSGTARVEGLGPHTRTQLERLVGHRHVTVKPVIDLNEQTSVNAYEYPEAMKERIHLRWAGDAFPHATRTTRSVDHDHPRSYDKDGPPDQTNSHTGQPLSRTAHRAKTHLGYRCSALPTGEVLWRTPHGLHRLVDAVGTHWIDASEYQDWLSEDPWYRALARVSHRVRIGAL